MATNLFYQSSMDRHIRQLRASAGLEDYSIEDQKRDARRDFEYRKIDQLTAQLEKELAAVRALRREMEQYKKEFAIEVNNTATKEVEKVVAEIDKLFSK